MKSIVKFLAVFCLSLTLGYLGWQKFSTISKASSQKVTSDGNNDILQGSYYEVSVPPRKIDTYLSAEYRIWIPSGVPKIQGLIVKQHGCGDSAAASGLEHANDPQWQALALKHQFALIGSKLPTGNKPCEYWALLNYGSGQAFLKGLQVLATKSHHPELEKVPWALWGHSGGADWASQMLQEYPERTLALVAVRGGGFLMLGINQKLAGIPVLFAAGANDPYASETLDLPKRVFLRYRKINAPWTFAVEANAGHECGNTRLLAIPYLDTILNRRVKPQKTKLNSIDLMQGWLGNSVTHAVAPIGSYKGNRLEAVWLPNEETALKWQQYTDSDKVLPNQKPKVPTNIKVRMPGGAEALLTWHYIPDTENGLPSFHIYRNNSLIGTIEGQKYNANDTVDSPRMVLEFTDQHTTLDSIYVISAFNKLGESASQPIKIAKDK